MSDLLIMYTIGLNRIEVWGDNVRTILQDGTMIVAAPNGDETLQDCIDHEVGHTWLAYVMGNSYSRVMWAVAHYYYKLDAKAVAYEEDAVIRYVKTFGSGPRPWSTYHD
jgi:hypothetical protein